MTLLTTECTLNGLDCSSNSRPQNSLVLCFLFFDMRNEKKGKKEKVWQEGEIEGSRDTIDREREWKREKKRGR